MRRQPVGRDAQRLPPDAVTGLWCERVAIVYDELVADGVDHARIKFVAATVMAWIVSDEDAAERYWRAGGRPGEAPSRAERRTSSTSTSTTGKPCDTGPGGGYAPASSVCCAPTPALPAR